MGNTGENNLVPVDDFFDRMLWPWQQEYLSCGSRWVIVNKSRNTGFTFVGLLHAVLHSLRHPGHTYFLATLKVEKAVDELVEPITHNILPALKRTTLRPALDGVDTYRRRIDFPNGSRIKAAANEVDYLRGPTRASYLFDESATWAARQHEALREAVYPIVRSEGMNPHGTLRMVSTPRPIQNLYREIWQRDDDKWDRQGVDIIEACECDGYPEDDPEQFRGDCATEDEYRQEYLKVFLDVEGNYFDRHELEMLTERPEHDADPQRWVGVDIGRKDDLTAIVCVESWHHDGDDYIHVDGLFLLDEVPFQTQEDVIVKLIEQFDADRARLDATKHPALCERIESQLAGDVKGLTGDRDRKVRLTQQVQSHIESETLSIAQDVYQWSGQGFVDGPDDRLIDDLAKVEESVTARGNIRYEAPRDDEGHADSYSALLLALACGETTSSGWHAGGNDSHDDTHDPELDPEEEVNLWR